MGSEVDVGAPQIQRGERHREREEQDGVEIPSREEARRHQRSLQDGHEQEQPVAVGQVGVVRKLLGGEQPPELEQHGERHEHRDEVPVRVVVEDIPDDRQHECQRREEPELLGDTGHVGPESRTRGGSVRVGRHEASTPFLACSE